MTTRVIVLRRGDTLLLGVVTLYVMAAAACSQLLGFRLPSPESYASIFRLYATIALFVIAGSYLIDLARDRPASPFAYARAFAERRRLAERARYGVTAILALSLFQATFSRMKTAIPQINPFHWDPIFARLDAALLGQDAWRLVHPIAGHYLVSSVLNWNYHLWLGAMFVVTFVASVLVDRPQLRFQYLLSYLLCWIVLGNLLATWLASVGPCFYQAFYGDDRFAPLMAYLHEADQAVGLPALKVQTMLLSMQTSPDGFVGKGISAMPSMHVSIALLFTLFARELGRGWAALSIVFLVLILIGSVHLGYHYAVDGLVSLIVTPLIWGAAGMVARSPWLVGVTAQPEKAAIA